MSHELLQSRRAARAVAIYYLKHRRLRYFATVQRRDAVWLANRISDVFERPTVVTELPTAGPAPAACTVAEARTREPHSRSDS